MGGKVFQSPLKQPSKTLDIGCANGIDVEDFPVPSQKSSNVQLFQKDIFDLPSNEHEDALAAESQDFILSRALDKYITDWPGYIKKASELLKPGGYLEVQETTDERWYEGDGKSADDGKLVSKDWDWLYFLESHPQYRGTDWDCGKNAAGRMKKAGFEDVQVKKFVFLWGDWLARQQGRIETLEYGTFHSKGLREYWKGRFEMDAPKAGRAKSAQEEAFGRWEEECERSLKKEDGRYQTHYVTWGRKPDQG